MITWWLVFTGSIATHGTPLLWPDGLIPSNIPVSTNTQWDEGSALNERDLSTIEIPLTGGGDGWMAKIGVGRADDLLLALDFGTPDLIVFPGFYEPSNESSNLHTNGSVSDKRPFVCSTPHWDYSLFTDVVSVNGLPIKAQIVLNDTRPDFDVSSTPADGQLGLAGLGRNSSLSQTRSWIDNFNVQYEHDQSRFGIAINTTGVGFFNGSGSLILGGYNSSFFEGNVVRAPVDLTRRKQNLDYADNYQQWWVRGDLVVAGSTDKRELLQNQSMYLDPNFPWVRSRFCPGHVQNDANAIQIAGPLQPVRLLFEELDLSAKILNDTCSPKSPYVVGYFDCSSPPPRTEIRFNGNSSLLTATEIGAHYSPYNNGTCEHGIWGQEMGNEPFWVLGAPFFNGRYADFNSESNTVSFASLKEYVLPIRT